MAKVLKLRSQRGYLLEIPVLLVVVVIVMLVIIPHLPPLGQKIAITIGAALILFFLFYMIVVPGWTPSGHLNWPWNWVVFLLIAILIVSAVVSFMFT